MATSSANNHHTLDPFLLYLSSSVIFPGLPLAPHTQGTPNKKSILSTRQCHHNYSSQTAIEDKLHLHCLFTRSLWLSSSPLTTPPPLSLLSPSLHLPPNWSLDGDTQRGVATGDGATKEQKRTSSLDYLNTSWNMASAYQWSHNFRPSGQLPPSVQQLFCLNTRSSKQIFSPTLTSSVGNQKKKTKKTCLIFAYVVLEWVMFKYHLRASGRFKLRAASSSAPGQASSGER